MCRVDVRFGKVRVGALAQDSVRATVLRPEISASLAFRPLLRQAIGSVFALVSCCDRLSLPAVCLRPDRSSIACRIQYGSSPLPDLDITTTYPSLPAPVTDDDYARVSDNDEAAHACSILIITMRKLTAMWAAPS